MRFNGKISDNFMWTELVREADQRYLDGADIVALRCLARYVLERIRAIVGYPLIVTSGFRTYTHNIEVGGAEHSQHLLGEAADIVCPGVTMRDLAAAAKEAGSFKTFIYDDHIHVSIPSRDLVHHDLPLLKDLRSKP